MAARMNFRDQKEPAHIDHEGRIWCSLCGWNLNMHESEIARLLAASPRINEFIICSDCKEKALSEYTVHLPKTLNQIELGVGKLVVCAKCGKLHENTWGAYKRPFKCPIPPHNYVKLNFCSKKCYTQTHEPLIIKKCPVCKKDFFGNEYCSTKCSQKAVAQAMKTRKIIKAPLRACMDLNTLTQSFTNLTQEIQK